MTISDTRIVEYEQALTVLSEQIDRAVDFLVEWAPVRLTQVFDAPDQYGRYRHYSLTWHPSTRDDEDDDLKALTVVAVTQDKTDPGYRACPLKNAPVRVRLLAVRALVLLCEEAKVHPANAVQKEAESLRDFLSGVK